MHVLIGYAHPELHSFNGAMKDLAVATLTGAGHQVTVPDLYAQNFNPIAGRHDFIARAEQAHAARTSGFAPDVQREIDRLLAADLLILQFPFWWYSVPAILKSWIDRVFAYGVTYDFGRTWDRGVLRSRRAMLSFATSAPPTASMPDGRNGELDRMLWLLHAGVLALCGYGVLQPFVAHAVAGLTTRAGRARRGSICQIRSETRKSCSAGKSATSPSPGSSRLKIRR